MGFAGGIVEALPFQIGTVVRLGRIGLKGIDRHGGRRVVGNEVKAEGIHMELAHGTGTPAVSTEVLHEVDRLRTHVALESVLTVGLAVLPPQHAHS